MKGTQSQKRQRGSRCRFWLCMVRNFVPGVLLLGNSKVPLSISPRAVDVVGGIPRGIRLHVEELDDERRPVDAVRVRFAGFNSARVGKVDLVETRLLGGVAWHVDVSAGSAGLVCSLTKSSGPAGAFKFELPYDGDVTILVCPCDSKIPVATQEIGFSAGDRTDLTLRVIEK